VTTVLIAPDEFTGSLTAVPVGEAVATGIRRARADVQVAVLPVADGDAGISAAYPLTDLEPDLQRCITGPAPLLERLGEQLAAEHLPS
jgi:glycerate kinase